MAIQKEGGDLSSLITLLGMNQQNADMSPFTRASEGMASLVSGAMQNAYNQKQAMERQQQAQQFEISPEALDFELQRARELGDVALENEILRYQKMIPLKLDEAQQMGEIGLGFDRQRADYQLDNQMALEENRALGIPESVLEFTNKKHEEFDNDVYEISSSGVYREDVKEDMIAQVEAKRSAMEALYRLPPRKALEFEDKFNSTVRNIPGVGMVQLKKTANGDTFFEPWDDGKKEKKETPVTFSDLTSDAEGRQKYLINPYKDYRTKVTSEISDIQSELDAIGDLTSMKEGVDTAKAAMDSANENNKDDLTEKYNVASADYYSTLSQQKALQAKLKGAQSRMMTIEEFQAEQEAYDRGETFDLDRYRAQRALSQYNPNDVLKATEEVARRNAPAQTKEDIPTISAEVWKNLKSGDKFYDEQGNIRVKP